MENYAARVKEYIIDNFLFGVDGDALGEDDSFLQNGIIDSTGIVEVVAWIEETYGVKVRDMDLLPENFDSVNQLAAYIGRNVSASQTP
jgi:acyl carrier protein